MKRNDIILAAVLICCIAAAYLILKGTAVQGSIAVVSVGGVKGQSLPLSKSADIIIEDGRGGRNRLLIKDGLASITEADCPDRSCVRQKAVSKDGESIICLPHKVAITIESEETAAYDAVSN